MDESELASTINYTAEPVIKIQRGKDVTYTTALTNVKVGRRFAYTPEETVFAPASEHVVGTATTTKAPPKPPKKAPSQPEEKPSPAPPPPPEDKPLLPSLSEGIKKLAPAETESPSPPKLPSPPKPPQIPKTGAPPQTEEEKKPPKEEETPLPPPPKKVKQKALPKKKKPLPTLAITDIPNAISGTVYDEKGAVLSDLLVSVANEEGRTLVATKTNKLGQFSLSPLPNGKYTVSIQKSDLSFDIMEVVLKGSVSPPLEIKAKGEGGVRQESKT
jgi:hypothetical protein